MRGFGLGYRTPFYQTVLDDPGAAAGVDWFEIVSENFMGLGGRPRRFLDALRSHFPVAMHGVSLSLASETPVFRKYLGALRDLVQICDPWIISDHLCWTSHKGQNSHDLLPVLYTESRLRELSLRLQEIQEFLGRRLYLENPSAYVAFHANEMDEASFLAELVRRSGCGLLLDVNNLYVNHKNLGFDIGSYLAALPSDAIGYFHLAGHSQGEGVLIDTHDHPVCPEVWDLYRICVQRWPSAPTLLEWDDQIPEYSELLAELDRARSIHRQALEAAVATNKEGRQDAVLDMPSVSLNKNMREAAHSKPCHDVFFEMMTGAFHTCNGDLEDKRLAILDPNLPVRRARGMGVYHSAYFLRLRECLSSIFPTLAGVMTAEGFDRVAAAYLHACPPEHYSIKYAGARFANFLAETALEGDFGVPLRWLADIVRLEWIMEEFYDQEDGPPPAGIDLLATIPPDAWASVRFALKSCVAVISTEIDVGSLVLTIQNGQTPKRPQADTRAYLVYRKQEQVAWEEIDAQAHNFYESFLKDGHFYGACERYALSWGMDLDAAVPQVLPQLQRLFDLEIVTGMRLGHD